ncbi:hypothetical protein [Pseudoalteromonas sp. SK20]|uniref:hypothetical protein n=1 Tax=Pseudoalteromonas sp. SK20 TaxID=1938367 RepID=UPI0009770985|nr:hypothetical protein [Pseudoalteromonas sp. SK20]
MTQRELNNNLTESEILKQAADLVGRGNVIGAIKLLEHWQKEMPFSLRVLNTLTPLYYKVGDFDRAGKISFKTLSKEPEQEIKSNLGDLPASADLTFLEEQETNLTEAEYSFDDETTVEPVKRKVLSLKLDKTKKTKDKVTIKHKFRRVLKSFKSKLTDQAPAKNTTVSDVIAADPIEKNNNLSTSYQLSDPKEVELARPVLSLNKNTEKPPKQKVDVNNSVPGNVKPTVNTALTNTQPSIEHAPEEKPKRAVLTLKGKDTSQSANTQQIPKIVVKSKIKSLDNNGTSALNEETKRESLTALKEEAGKPLRPDTSELQSKLQHAKQSATDEVSSQNKVVEQPVKEPVFTEAINTVLLAKSNVNLISDEPSELKGNDLIEDDLEIERFGDLADFDESIEVEAGSFDTFSDDLYGLWDDSFDDEVEHFTDNGALDNTFSQEDRAVTEAAELITSFDWERSALPFLTEVLCVKGWVNAKRALEREVAAGATVDELMLAFEVKNLWLDSPRYWIAFSKAYVSGESTDAIYRHFSWRQALRLIRTFNDLPSFEEVYDLLEQEFDYWYDHKILRLCFPAFIKYLFNYRLNERNITSSIGGFSKAQGYDHIDELWASQTHSEEMQKLNEYGVDLLAKNAQPSYYTSDTYTREYLLEYFRSFLPDDEKDKNYE